MTSCDTDVKQNTTLFDQIPAFESSAPRNIEPLLRHSDRNKNSEQKAFKNRLQKIEFLMDLEPDYNDVEEIGAESTCLR